MLATASPLKDVSSHFRFGQNWASYSQLVDRARVDQATRDLQAFLGRSDLSGGRFSTSDPVPESTRWQPSPSAPGTSPRSISTPTP